MDLERKNRAYRRALTLGLTLAEIFVLLVFVLLLAFAGYYKHTAALSMTFPDLQRESELQAAAINALKEVNGQLQRESTYLKAQLRAPNHFDDLFRELRLQKARIAQLDAQITELGKERTSIPSLEQAIAAESGSTGKDPQAILQDLITSANDAKREQQRLQGELVYYQKKLAATGNGTVLPSCWTTPDGKIEYIFDVTLVSDGITVHDNALADHLQDEQQLIPKMSFGSVLNDNQFLQMTQTLYAWSRAQHPECRFFVRLLDRTKDDEKALYKSELQAVEGHFYKLPVATLPSANGGD